MKKCENCDNDHDSNYGSGRFCSSKCSRSFSTKDKRSLINEKVSKSLTKDAYKKICKFCKNEFETKRKQRLFCSNSCASFYKMQNTDCKIKISTACKKAGCGGLRKNSTRGKSGWYKGYWCDSSWELAYVIYNLEHNIKFERNKKGFEYIYENQTHKYYPDFILEDGTYIEIKNFKSNITDAKIFYFKNKIKILYKNEIKLYLDYVITKYGKNFINLYE